MITDQSNAPADLDATPEPDGSQRVLSHDKVFHLLQNERRRRVIRYLHDKEGKTDMRDIAEKVAAWEHDKTVRTLSSEERQRVYIPLYQNHLPKLDDEGIIDYNQSRGTVERNPLADQLETHLFERADERPPETSAPAADTQEAPQYSYSLVASGVASILLITAALGLPILSSPPDLLFGTLILLVFLGAELLRQRPLR
ncbi:hypothetical protein [Haloarchaeobius sp. FL176]|uniref:DUF7344 domain-containing protein n=1 Tax=Haloarchaeobius sp. FL176 TaxID=2967129 RepID=UPI0021484E52|nr:hypothetical protein [Haloarchaeobius sp. FL176]